MLAQRHFVSCFKTLFCCSDDFGERISGQTTLPNRHPSKKSVFRCRVATCPHKISGIGYQVNTQILPKMSGVGCPSGARPWLRHTAFDVRSLAKLVGEGPSSRQISLAPTPTPHLLASIPAVRSSATSSPRDNLSIKLEK
jgi:hypothetical protein